MKEQIEKLVSKLRAMQVTAEQNHNNISRDLAFRDQDRISGKVYNAVANDLQKIIDEAEDKTIRENLKEGVEREIIEVDVSGLSSEEIDSCLLYTSPSPRDRQKSRMPSSA